MWQGSLLGKLHYHKKEKSENKKCVFVGPSMWHWRGQQQKVIESVSSDITYYGPAALGHIHQAVLSGYKYIGLIDGRFGDCPATWHKEILFALDSGCKVYGASSMGALRAAELYDFGMQGVGEVFSMYKNNIIENDDAVCVAHSNEDYMYRPFSLALVDIMSSIRRLERTALNKISVNNKIIDELTQTHYPRRTWQALKKAFSQNGYGQKAYQQLVDNYINSKHDDLTQLIERLHSVEVQSKQYRIKQQSKKWKFPVTDHWRQQFILQRHDLPELKMIKELSE